MKVEVNTKLRIKHIDLHPKTSLSTVRSCIYFSTSFGSVCHGSGFFRSTRFQLCSCIFCPIILEQNDCIML